MNNDELNIKKEDSLSNTTPIKKIEVRISRDLWEAAEKYRNKQEGDVIDFSYENEKVEEKSKQKKLGTAAFTSISIMAVTTALVSIGILVLGTMILN